MGEYACHVCKDETVRRVVDEELLSGKSGTVISRLLTLRGEPLSAHIVNEHKKHWRAQAERVIAAKTKRDFAIMVQEEAADLFENGELELTNRNHVAGIQAGLSAQSILDKREAAKDPRIGLFVLMLGGPDGSLALAPLALSDGEEVYEGEAVEVD